jgi:hypothetical protein
LAGKNAGYFVIPAPACAKPKRLLHRNAIEGRLRFGEGRKAGIQYAPRLPLHSGLSWNNEPV